MRQDTTRSWYDESNRHMNATDRFEHNQSYYYQSGMPQLLRLLEHVLRYGSPGHQRYLQRHLWAALNDHINNPDGWTPNRDSKGRFISTEVKTNA